MNLFMVQFKELQDLEYHKNVSQLLMDAIDADRIKENLKLLTKKPHIAGTKENEEVAELIQTLWNEAGLQGIFFCFCEKDTFSDRINIRLGF